MSFLRVGHQHQTPLDIVHMLVYGREPRSCSPDGLRSINLSVEGKRVELHHPLI